MFSFVPRCNGLRGSAKKTFTRDSIINLAWSDRPTDCLNQNVKTREQSEIGKGFDKLFNLRRVQMVKAQG